MTSHSALPDLDLARIEAVVSDMDGVLWRGSEPLPGVAEFFARLDGLGVQYAFATNNSGKLASLYAERLQGMGVKGATERNVITSGSVTAEVLSESYPQGTAVHVLGSRALVEVLRRAGFAVDGHDAVSRVEVVVVGIDTDLTYVKLARAMEHVLAGAAFYGTNADVSLPTPSGFAPGAGSIIAALQAATGRSPTLMGKPEAHIYASAVRILGAAPERTLMIGDRLDTDVLGAQRFGMNAALVLTGVESAASATEAGLPTGAVFDDLPSLARAWDEALEGAGVAVGRRP